MNQIACNNQATYRWQKNMLLLLLVAMFLLLARIGARHYFRETAVEPGTFTIMIGRVFALWALALMLLQPLLAMRFRIFDRMFGLDRLLRMHRVAGIVSLTLAFLHPMLIYVSGLKRAGPLNAGQWPEALGGIGLAGLWLLIVSSCWRQFLELKYDSWLQLHRYAGPVAFLALVHMFAIESAMRKGWLAAFWLATLLLWAGTLIAQKKLWSGRGTASEAFVVAAADVAAESIWRIELKPAGETKVFKFIPGQFAFISFENERPGPEEHPFTIASAPAGADGLQFLIKTSGDWTSQLASVRVGDQARVSGPFGVFSPWRHDVSRLILIAGGIGITPMLSVLRQLREEKSQLPVKLVWTFQNRAGAPCLDEITGLRQALPGFEFVAVATRESSVDVDAHRRLDKQVLTKIMPQYQPGTMVMVCGPAQMMLAIRRDLLAMGYPPRAILSEEFAF